MANWKYTIDIADAWKEARANKMSVQTLSKILSKEIGKLLTKKSLVDDTELQDIQIEFDGLSEDKESDWNDFNNVMGELYDWGDTLLVKKNFYNDIKQCWIKTF
jgi:hypothetical protein